jgi:hypothetical protein
MAVNDSVGDFKFNSNSDAAVYNVYGGPNQVTVSGMVNSPEIETGQLSLDSSKITANVKKCNFCLSEPAAITFDTGKDRQGYCSKCLVAIFQFVRGTMTKKAATNEASVVCSGCGYRIHPNHGTEFRSKDVARVLCDRCIDAMGAELDARPDRFGKNIIV